MRKLVLGIIIGCLMTISTTVLAEDGLEKITAYLRKDMPIKLDGKKLELENAPLIYEGTTYLPLRETATIFGKEVKWNENTQTVELASSLSGTATSSPEGGKANMESQTTTAAAITETKYKDLRAVTSNNQTYFSPTDYNGKHPKDERTFNVDVTNRKMTINKKDATTLDLSLDDPDVIVIHKGETYINVKYYPGD